MKNNDVFEVDEEINRLIVQNNLFKHYEQPIYDRLLSGRSGLKLLDIGCSNGSKTVDRFTCGSITGVIGLEYHHDLAEQAQREHGNDTFAFYQCDVEEADFPRRLGELMTEHGVESFDIIHISLVLMHLKNAEKLLRRLRGFLAEGGSLVVVEADDSVSRVTPDEEHLYKDFLDILYQDPLSGDRWCGGKLPALLADCGYRQIAVENTLIEAGKSEIQRKDDIFDIFCSYLRQDVQFLREEEPHNPRYASWEAWLNQHYDRLHSLFLEKNVQVSMGISVITCFGA